MNHNILYLFLVFILSLLSVEAVADSSQLVGVNLSGAEYGGKQNDKAQHGFHYVWHSEKDIDRFIDAGFTVLRIPFLWERMQPNPNEYINNAEAIYLDKIVMHAQKKNIKILIDPHNFGFYKGKVIGSDVKSLKAFKDLWTQLANRYKRFPNVIFGLMNEPNKQNTIEWAKIAQAGVEGIREAGAKQLILVPGTYWSGAHSWTWGKGKENPSNADALKGIKDPLNNYAYEMHFYLDNYSSGTEEECVNESIGVERLKSTTKWLRSNHKKAFLGEFGVAANPTCLVALDKTLAFLKQNSDVWLGWTYWSASKWGGNYAFDIYSLDPTKQKQFGVISKYLKQ